jgi:hypothetical protein
MTTLPRRLVALATVVLVAAMVAVLALRAIGAPVANGPSAEASPSVAEPLPTPSDPNDPLTVFARIERQVSALRELPPARIGPPDVISRAELAGELKRVFDETWTPRQLAADNLTLRAMGLLTPRQDIRALTESLYEGQVLGFYDFDTRRMVVVSDEGMTAAAKITYAHEFTHAMQDAAFNTGADHEADAQEDDAALAKLALEEGDASVAMVRWAFDGTLSPDELGTVGSTPVPDMSGIPDWMVRQLTFPYETGAGFVSQLFARGGWDMVDTAYRQPPASTEQVIHIEKYLGREAPVRLADEPLAGELGTGWRSVESTTIGEAMIGIWLGQLGVGLADSTTAAEGWGGDRLSVAAGPAGQWAMAWQIAWDTPEDADEFVAQHGDITADLPFKTVIRRAGPTTTFVFHASSATVMRRLTDVVGD